MGNEEKLAKVKKILTKNKEIAQESIDKGIVINDYLDIDSSYSFCETINTNISKTLKENKYSYINRKIAIFKTNEGFIGKYRDIYFKMYKKEAFTWRYYYVFKITDEEKIIVYNFKGSRFNVVTFIDNICDVRVIDEAREKKLFEELKKIKESVEALIQINKKKSRL